MIKNLSISITHVVPYCLLFFFCEKIKNVVPYCHTILKTQVNLLTYSAQTKVKIKSRILFFFTSFIQFDGEESKRHKYKQAHDTLCKLMAICTCSLYPVSKKHRIGESY